METNTAKRLEQAIATLNGLVELAEECGLPESAQFLAMAKLHLQIDLNEVTDAEFRALCAVLEGKAASRATVRRRGPRSGATAAMASCARCAAPGNVRRTRPGGAAAAGAPGSDQPVTRTAHWR